VINCNFLQKLTIFIFEIQNLTVNIRYSKPNKPSECKYKSYRNEIFYLTLLLSRISLICLHIIPIESMEVEIPFNTNKNRLAGVVCVRMEKEDNWKISHQSEMLFDIASLMIEISFFGELWSIFFLYILWQIWWQNRLLWLLLPHGRFLEYIPQTVSKQCDIT